MRRIGVEIVPDRSTREWQPTVRVVVAIDNDRADPGGDEQADEDDTEHAVVVVQRIDAIPENTSQRELITHQSQRLNAADQKSQRRPTRR